jgi:kynurenine formamidase
MKQTCKLEQLNLHGHLYDIILALVVACHSALLRKQVLHIEVLTNVSRTPSSLVYLQIYIYIYIYDKA